MQLRYAARSDVGLVRQGNEDSGYAGPSLLVIADGMGGHAAGAAAAELACRELQRRFAAESQPMLDPLGFLHLALGYAHTAMVGLGADMPMERRPRATCAASASRARRMRRNCSRSLIPCSQIISSWQNICGC